MNSTRICQAVPPHTLHMLRCPHCQQPLALEDLPTGSRLSDPVAHALIDHLLLIESELSQLRRLLIEEILP